MLVFGLFCIDQTFRACYAPPGGAVAVGSFWTFPTPAFRVSADRPILKMTTGLPRVVFGEKLNLRKISYAKNAYYNNS